MLQERGLSVLHFLIDNDRTIYQALDPADCAFHAAGANGPRLASSCATAVSGAGPELLPEGASS